MTRDALTPPRYATRDASGCASAELLEFKLWQGKSPKRSFAQRLGLAYEKKAIRFLNQTLSEPVYDHPAFRFNAGQVFDEHAIPDAMYLWDQVLTVFEIKLKHTADAWHQLNKLYLPILSRAFPGKHINLCELCRDYDPSIKLPHCEFPNDLKAFTSTPQDSYGIYIYTGRT